MKDRWLTDGIPSVYGASDREIDTFELAFNVRLPQDIAEYFRVANGMPPNTEDSEGFRWWPLTEVRPAAVVDASLDPSAYDRLFVFADFLLMSHFYAVDLTDPQSRSRVVFAGSQRPTIVAPSFEDFVEKYLRDPWALFPKK